MTKKGLLLALAMFVAMGLGSVFFAGCSSGGSSGGGGGAATGTIVGKVSNNMTGAAIANAVVSDGTASTTTAADGSYTIANASPSSNTIVTITAANYAYASKITRVTAGNTTRVDVALQPVAASLSISSLATAQSLTVTGSPAQVVIPANGLVTGSGSAPSLPITADLTPIDPSSNPQIMPGDFTTSAGSQIESFGAMEVSFTDSSGAPLNLATGQTATIRIPVAAVDQGSAPATMTAFYYNSTTGVWVQEGTLTLNGTAPDQYYEGTVAHFTYWNSDQVYDTTCVTGVVKNSSGAPVADARVEAEGRDYTGTSQAYTAADGTFSIDVKANAQVIVTAYTSDALSNSEVVDTGSAGATCTPLTNDLTLGAVFGSAGSGSAKIKLTWGADPSDLDSHLTGPDSANPGTRFHVYYSNLGDLATDPYAALDVDDTTSFGPEVITISKFIPGTYRYSVHHYAGSGDIYSSPARVELTLNGSTTIFTPPNPGSTVIGVDTVWQVFELVVDANGNVTVNPLGTYVTNVSSDAVTAPAFGRTTATKPVWGSWDW